MAITSARTIAEYAIMRWLMAQNFALEFFQLAMDGNTGILRDQSGESMTLAYDPDEKSVYIKEE